MDGVWVMELLVYVFFPQRLLKCSRLSCYRTCWISCEVLGDRSVRGPWLTPL